MTNPTKAAIALDELANKPLREWSDATCAAIPEGLKLLAAKQRGDDGWLPIDENTPRDGSSILLAGHKGAVWIGHYHKSSMMDGYLWSVGPGVWIQEDHATHWQPLPSAPKETI